MIARISAAAGVFALGLAVLTGCGTSPGSPAPVLDTAPISTSAPSPAATSVPAAISVPAATSAVVAPPAPTSRAQSVQTRAAAPKTTAAKPAAPQGNAVTCSGGYINSDGNCIPRPTKAATAPAGATAKCNDGTYSFSAHRQGTCSGHGGVGQWL